MEFVISPKVAGKLAEREITARECEECFENRDGRFIVDARENNRTDPSTLWFLAITNAKRLLKIVFIFRPDTGEYFLKTAHVPKQKIIDAYIRQNQEE